MQSYKFRVIVSGSYAAVGGNRFQSVRYVRATGRAEAVSKVMAEFAAMTPPPPFDSVSVESMGWVSRQEQAEKAPTID